MIQAVIPWLIATPIAVVYLYGVGRTARALLPKMVQSIADWGWYGSYKSDRYVGTGAAVVFSVLWPVTWLPVLLIQGVYRWLWAPVRALTASIATAEQAEILWKERLQAIDDGQADPHGFERAAVEELARMATQRVAELRKRQKPWM